MAGASALWLAPGLAQAAGAITATPSAGASYTGDVLHITANGTYTLSMTTPGATTTTDRIVVDAGVTANITLNGVKIDLSGTSFVAGNPCSSSAFDMAGATVNLTLANGSVNQLSSGYRCAGLHVPNDGAALTINGATPGGLSGELTANAGSGGAGIGSNLGENAGAITINGGTVNANGGNALGVVAWAIQSGGGSGIGGGSQDNGTNLGGGSTSVTITGGKVAATGGNGTGGLAGGAGIGVGHGVGTGGTITISGGTVTATAGSANGGSFTNPGSAAGIGGLNSNITISGNADVTATGSTVINSVPGSSGGVGIGGTSATVTITGHASAQAQAGGGSGNAGGASGIGTNGSRSGTPYLPGTITIDTAGTVTATGSPGNGTGGNGANIGQGGYVTGDGVGLDSVPPAPLNGGNVTAQPGGNATLTCPATGAGYTYQWQQWQGTPAPGSWQDMAGATGATLNLTGVTTAMSGSKYHCVTTLADAGGNPVFAFTGYPSLLTVQTSTTAAAVPTLNEWALMLLTLAMLGMAGLRAKRRGLPCQPVGWDEA